MIRRFYRIIKGDQPTQSGFMSNAAMGKAPRRSERTNPEEHRSISVFARLEEARDLQRAMPQLGNYIAEIELNTEDLDIVVLERGDPPPNNSHYNLRGEPAAFLERVRQVLPV
jgi:hypothetical protein